MAKAIMVQGTMSNAGKSILAAGLCRVFRQDGCRVAPFKAQNMALNSFITREGLEMGRAQVVQAEAAGVEPSVLMNPILLKPTNDTGSQVIVNGEVWGQMTAREYFAVKKQLVPDVMRAYQQLSNENDVIVIEGAGSPAEINLKNDDCFVNMGMAKAAKAPVLLVGDASHTAFAFSHGIGPNGPTEADERIGQRSLDRLRAFVARHRLHPAGAWLGAGQRGRGDCAPQGTPPQARSQGAGCHARQARRQHGRLGGAGL